MKDNKRQMQRLLDLGLTEREAKVYIILLGKKGFTTRELQDLAIIPRTKIYEVLHKLIARGFCTERFIGRLKYYEAIEPKIALQHIIDEYNEDYQSELEKKMDLIEKLSGMLNPVFEKNKDVVTPLDFVQVFRDPEQIQKKYVQAIHETQFDFLTFNKGPYVCANPKRLRQQESAESNLIKRGVACRNIYEEHELVDHDWLRKYLKHLVALGQQAKVTTSLPIKMVVCDERTVIFPLLQTIGDSNNITMIFIEHHELAVACKMLFNMMWEYSKPVK
jgi:HTH-type transcriptional regulator, sugar sensing transcriptional regulator